MSSGTDSAICKETTAIAKQLVELCEQDRNIEAVETLYSDDIVSIEVSGMPEMGMPREMKGKEAILGKHKWWYENHEVHGGSTEGPYPHGNQFIVIFGMDITAKVGPMAGQRMQMKEAGLYTVEGGKIVREQFFYDMGDC